MINVNITIYSKCLDAILFLKLLKAVFYSHQGCVYLIRKKKSKSISFF